MIALLVASVTTVSHILMQSQVFQRIEVGVVVPGEDAMTQTVIQFISAMKSVRTVCSFRYMEEEAARDGIAEGDLQAVILLPVNFYEDVDSGKNTPAQIIIPEESALNVQVFQELLGDGVSLLQTAEAGVYATYDILETQEALLPAAEIGDDLTEQYVMAALDRQSIYEEQVLSPFGNMVSVQYYYLAACFLILLLAGLHMGYLYRRQSRVVEQQLTVFGLGRGRLLILKTGVMTFFLCLLFLVLATAGSLLTRYTSLELFYWYPGELLGWLPVGISISAFFYMVYEVTDGGVQGVTVLLAVSLVLVLLSGLILPEAYLPQWLVPVGKMMPLHIWVRYTEALLYGRLTGAAVALLFAVTGIELGIGGIASCKKS